MNDSLDGARLKVARAEEHLRGLEHQIRAYLDTHPCEVIKKWPGDQRVSSILVRVPPLAQEHSSARQLGRAAEVRVIVFMRYQLLVNDSMDDRAGRRVRELMEQLDSLVDGEAAAAHLVACGRVAIEPLRHFVLESPARGVAQPRCWAVQALAGLGAKDILIEYLQRDIVIADPVVTLAEEAVQRAAALALAAWRTADVFDVLLMLTIRHRIPGVIEALGRFERRDAVPVLLDALEDDFCRPWAETALDQVADRDRDLLIRSALVPMPNADEETECSLRRRRALVRLLRHVQLSSDESHRMARLIDSSDLELAIDAAALAIKFGHEADAHRARQRLWRIAPLAPWHLHSDVQSLLHPPAPENERRER